MSDGTHIEWADATVNAVNGCSVVSPGCTNCYAMRLAGGRLRSNPSRAGLTRPSKAGPVWTGEVRLHEPALMQPLRWRRPRKIFWNAHGDLFHENVPDEWIDRCFAVMALTPQHIHQVLTKRPERARAWFERYDAAHDDNCADMVGRALTRGPLPDAARITDRWRNEAADRLARWPLRNVWLGTSVEDQARADERIPHLLAAPAAVRFLSCEPLLGLVDLTTINVLPKSASGAHLDALKGFRRNDPGEPWARLHWVIVGGESGPGARPMHPDWVRSLRDQCAAAGVPFFFKQWGNWAPIGCIEDDRGDTDETIRAETAMMDAMQTLADGELWIDPRRVQLVDRGMFNWANEDAQPPPHAVVIKQVGKAKAGRLLAGVEHNGMPA